MYDGSTQVDLSDHVLEQTPVAYSPLDVVGFVKSECTLTIGNVHDATLTLDTLFNTLWQRGNRITLDVRNAANTAYIRNRELYILQSIYDDGRREEGAESPSLQLKLGCKIALLDSDYQSQAGYQIPILTPNPWIPFRQLIGYWLEYFGFPPLVEVTGDYDENPHVIFDHSYSPGTSAATHLGMLFHTYTRGGHWWIDAQGNSRISKPDLLPTTADFELVGEDCAINQRSQGEREKVPGLVKVFGVSNYVSIATDPPPSDSSITTGNVTETSTISVVTTSNSRTTTKTGSQTITGVSVSTGTGGSGSNLGNIGQFSEVTIEEFVGGFPAQPNPIPGQPDIPGVQPWLSRVTQNISEQRAVPGSNNLGGLSQTKQVVTDYFYRNTFTTHMGVTVTGVEIYKIVTTTKILPESNTGGFDTNALVDEISATDYTYLGPKSYKESVTIIRPNDTENRRQRPEPRNVEAPPGVTFAPERFNTQQVEIYGQSRFQYPPGAAQNNVPREFDFKGYLPSNDAAEDLAKYHQTLIIGRDEPQKLAFTPTDAYLADPRPGGIAYIIRDDDPTLSDVFLLDGTSIFLGTTKTYITATGIRLGRRDNTTGEITQLFSQVVRVWATETGQEILTPDGQVIALV